MQLSIYHVTLKTKKKSVNFVSKQNTSRQRGTEILRPPDLAPQILVCGFGSLGGTAVDGAVPKSVAVKLDGVISSPLQKSREPRELND